MDNQQDDVTFCVAFPPTPETEVFVNDGGGVSVKQYDEAGYETVIAFSVQMAPAVAKAILQAAEAASHVTPD